jgi:hypothetical protein
MTGFHLFFDGDVPCLKSQNVTRHKDQTRVLDRRHHFVRVGEPCGHGLLDKDVLSVFKRGEYWF